MSAARNIDPAFDDDGEPREPNCVEDGDPDSKRCNCLKCATSLAEQEAYYRASYLAASPEERRAVIEGDTECKWCRAAVSDGAHLDDSGYCRDFDCADLAKADRRMAIGDMRRAS